MATENEAQVNPGDDRRKLLSPRKSAVLEASVMWGGENALGAIPLLAYLLVHRKRGSVPTFRWCPGCGVMPTHER
jgi:hypothetical protein